MLIQLARKVSHDILYELVWRIEVQTVVVKEEAILLHDVSEHLIEQLLLDLGTQLIPERVIGKRLSDGEANNG